MEFLQVLVIMALVLFALYVALMRHIERWLDNVFQNVGLSRGEIQDMAWTRLHNKK